MTDVEVGRQPPPAVEPRRSWFTYSPTRAPTPATPPPGEQISEPDAGDTPPVSNAPLAPADPAESVAPAGDLAVEYAADGEGTVLGHDDGDAAGDTGEAPVPHATEAPRPAEDDGDAAADAAPAAGEAPVPHAVEALDAADDPPADVAQGQSPDEGVTPEADPEPGPRDADVHHLRPPSPRPLPRAIAVANQKGGVGKTTTAVNLGAGLAELGFRVLVIDLDPQGNATTGLGINPRGLSASIYDVLMSDTPLEDCVEPTALRNLYVAPATIDLAGAEIELVPAFSRELRLRRAIERVGDDYDYILIDCPPSLGLLTINGLAAVSEILVPIQCEYYALEGLGQLTRNISLVQSNLNPRLELSTIVMTMYDARTKLADQVVREVRNHFGPKVCRSIVPRTVRLSEAPSFGQPILVFDPMSRGAIAYRELAKEVSGGAARRTG